MWHKNVRTVCSYLLIITALACAKEKVQVSEKENTYYKIPQGNAPYDQQVVDWYNKYGTYVLYQYPKSEYEYAIIGYYGLNMEHPADKTALPAVMNFIQQYWFDFYPEDFLKKYLPRKILLGGILQYDAGNNTKPDTLANPIAGFNFIMLPGLDANFPKQLEKERRIWKASLNSLFFSTLFYGTTEEIKAKLPLPEAFFQVSKYQQLKASVNNLYDNGYLAPDPSDPTKIPSPKNDLKNYLYIMCRYSEEELEKNYFSEKFDKKGLIRKKHQLLRKYIKDNWNVDLQNIGNKQN
ncbi:putative zinc-binding metallopeptidase [Chitinophaga pendula]|uniref:putative zinc-binding metallopeptidase n=1 Tax=Chitinophaga TaxID=79328 RepID=UPI000BAE77CC|nr:MULTISPECIES: putative zinc-binding metallopeptidase [Chitinophaga]ASZ09895.1 hypothetical protein CK934_02315 [Chitinophaga sp. MD30]UCJ07164.1 putative zinc-binding metallopeptidase [Chitinophaga pendula]